MPAKILDGKKLAERIKENLKQHIKKLPAQPGLAIILAGNNPASEIYVSNKRKACEEVGIYSELHKVPENVGEEQLLNLINRINSNPKIHGCIVQMPLPKHLNEQKIIDALCPLKDVDGLTTFNQGRLLGGKNAMHIPATPLGVMKLIESTGIKLKGKHAVVLGRSNLVGKPAALLLQQENCTVTVCHSKTKNIPAICRTADILVSAIGKPLFIKANMIKRGAVVIDVGISRVGNKVVGDVDFENVRKVAGWVTPVPGGVGPMTVACLLENVVKAAKEADRYR